MREIKFRVWDPSRRPGENMCYPKTEMKNYNYCGWGWIVDQIGQVFEYDYDCCCNMKQIEDVVVMQFTGLRDKNGKEIYEGDIVKTHCHYNNIGYIKYSGLAFEFTFPNGSGCPNYDGDDFEKFEIIGNIYKNPELLEEK